MLNSANDAATAIAIAVGGSVEGFARMMNERARELGLGDTNFTNPYTSAYDLFLITKYAWETYPVFREIVNMREHLFPPNGKPSSPLTVQNTNRLLVNTSPYFYEFASGVKTGSLPYLYCFEKQDFETGVFGLVSTASRSGYTYLVVTLGAPFRGAANRAEAEGYTYNDHLDLYRWAFTALEYKNVLSVNDILKQVTVLNGADADRVQLQPASSFDYLLPRNLDRSAVLKEVTVFNEEVEAPITKGEILGYVELKLGNELLATINLVALNDVPKSVEARVWDRVDRFMFGTIRNVTDEHGNTVLDEDGEIVTERGIPWGIIFILTIVMLAGFIVVLRIINKQRAKARKAARRKW
jgi:D-alanyl-D-alanine carboxypeptidase (penicillin-binding protein 5/6)